MFTENLKLLASARALALVCAMAFAVFSCSDDSAGTPGDAAVDAQDTPDAEIDSGPPPSPPGGECWLDSDCGQGGLCWRADRVGFPNGYCTIENCTTGSCPGDSVCFEFSDGVNRCLASCQGDNDCRLDEGYVCDGDYTCWPGLYTAPPGGSCGTHRHCQGGSNNAYCIRSARFLGGYCVIIDCVPSCPTGSQCNQIFTSGASACVPSCQTDEDCRPGYVCVDDSGSPWDGSCVPACTLDADCPGDLECRDDLCTDVSFECSPENTHGDCPPGGVCNAGTCAPFTCDDQLLEPNETLQAAQPLPAADTDGFQICQGDDDWYSFTPDQAGTLYMVGVNADYYAGNLEFELRDATGQSNNSAMFVPGDYHEENDIGPLLEFQSLVGGTGADEMFFHIYANGSTENTYGLIVRQIPWQDGDSCTTVFIEQDCWALNVLGIHDSSKLLVFPIGHAADPYIGDGVAFDNPLSSNPPYTSTASLWGRRELIMIIRYAIHEVQQTFPGTAPLGIGDIGMPDGTTPRGHPNGTHYLGANVDVAYYIDPQYHGVWGNMAYRPICCDSNPSDYSCVVTSTSNPEYGTCIPGSENTHIVDLPRTALFIAKIAGTGRMRAVGAEAKVEAGLEAALDDLVTQGHITSVERNMAVQGIMTANDHSSWIWHFHHMHVSFDTDQISQKSSGIQGLWPDLPLDEQARLIREWIPPQVP